MFEHFICFVQTKEKDPIKVRSYSHMKNNYCIFIPYLDTIINFFFVVQMILPLKAIMRIRKLDSKSNNIIELTTVKRLYKNNVS